MVKVLKEGTSEGFDRYGIYGEAETVYEAKVQLLEEEAETYRCVPVCPTGAR